MNPLPLKWIKYLVLAEYGLSNMQSIEARIKRFDTTDLQSFLQCIKSTLVRDLGNNDSVLFIVKLIRHDAYYKLPNIRLSHLDDFNDMLQFLTVSGATEKYDEIWFCKNNKSPKKDMVCGRLCIYETANEVKQIIECVFNTTPRMIETYHKMSGVSFFSAERLNWGMRYNIRELDVINSGMGKSFTGLFVEAAKEIERNRSCIRLMFNDLKSLGLDVASFEFIYDGSLQFIDWDTANDSLVIEKYKALG